MKTKEELGEDRYKVLREGATEAPFTGPLLNNKADGVYACGFCGEELFKSENKYDSHCGWPSFDDEIPGKVKKLEDKSHGMIRTEIQCAKCDSHLGHIFDDGPKDTTGLRYCVNSLSLDFEAKDES